MLTGSLAGGLYDIAHNLQKLAAAKEEEQDMFKRYDAYLKYRENNKMWK